jgi:hypothetical protein
LTLYEVAATHITYPTPSEIASKDVPAFYLASRDGIENAHHAHRVALQILQAGRETAPADFEISVTMADPGGDSAPAGPSDGLTLRDRNVLVSLVDAEILSMNQTGSPDHSHAEGIEQLEQTRTRLQRSTRPDGATAFDAAEEAYHEACEQMIAAAESEAWRVVLSEFPDAVSFTTIGSWETNEGETVMRLSLNEIAGPQDPYDAKQLAKQWRNVENRLEGATAPLVWMGDLGGPAYDGETVFEREG